MPRTPGRATALKNGGPRRERMLNHTQARRGALLQARRATVSRGGGVAGWAYLLHKPRPETARSKWMARLGVVTSILALCIYLVWRVAFTMPGGGWNLAAASILVAFEAFPLLGLFIRAVTLWNIDTGGPEPVTEAGPGHRVAVFIPTYNEPIEVIGPTIAAATELQPDHQTWVLDDGDRDWVASLCAEYGARYVRREVHDHAKAGNMNHALDLLKSEVAAGGDPVDIIAVLDCDHVPLPWFLTDTIGWFDDPQLALVQGPQSYYNAAAFDDDGDTGEQGLFFHVQMPARNHDGAGPFWCGSTSLIRLRAITDVGGISTETIVEDMHTTLNLLREGWKTAYHHQTLAVGLAPATPDQYLLQRRRWGMGAMQVLVRERLWGAKRWLSWRNYYEYLSGTLWWLEGVGTVLVFVIPAAVLVSGAQTSTAPPLVFAVVFATVFLLRLWGARQLYRLHIRWSTAFALRILRVPVGISCLWWLITRRSLKFEVTPKAGADSRQRGRAPRVLWLLTAIVLASMTYAILGLTGWVPWHATPSATVASGVWLILAAIVLVMGTRRISADDYATSRRNAHRIPLSAQVILSGVEGDLVNISVGGAAVRFPRGAFRGADLVELTLPGAASVPMEVVRTQSRPDGDVVSLSLAAGDWQSYRTMSLWLFHTPEGAVAGLPLDAPAVAARKALRRSSVPTLVRQYG